MGLGVLEPGSSGTPDGVGQRPDDLGERGVDEVVGSPAGSASTIAMASASPPSAVKTTGGSFTAFPSQYPPERATGRLVRDVRLPQDGDVAPGSSLVDP